jgi:hypothetical protein
MGIEFGYARLSPATPTCALQFSSTVTAATAGITAFELAFGTTPYPVDRVDTLLRLEIGMVVTRSGNTVSVNMSGTFGLDGGDKQMSTGRSFVDVAVIAVVGPNNGVQLPDPVTAQSGAAGTFTFEPSVSDLGLFISGLRFAAPNNDSVYVSQITAASGSTTASHFTTVTPDARLTINTDGVDHGGAITVGAVGLTSNSGIYGMVIRPNCTFSGQDANRGDGDYDLRFYADVDLTPDLDFSPTEIATTTALRFDLSGLFDTTRYELAGAVPLLQGFSMQFPDNGSQSLTAIRVGALFNDPATHTLFTRDAAQFLGAPTCPTEGPSSISNQAVIVGADGSVTVRAHAVMWRDPLVFKNFHNSTTNSVTFLLVGVIRAKSSAS